MKYVPKSATRLASRALLHAKAKSPTILVVSGVVGLGATAVMAAKASRKTDPIMEDHQKARWDIEAAGMQKRQHQRALLDLYTHTGLQLGKVYGPSIFVGTASAISVLGGHKILVGRHVASMAAYSGLFSEFNAYRRRVAETFGEDKERDLFKGAKLAYVEDPDHKGEYKLEAQYPETDDSTYLRAWFTEKNPNWVNDPASSFSFLKGVQAHMNNILQIKGHVFLNDVMDALHMPRTPDGQVAGWFRDRKDGEDEFIDFGLWDNDPHTVAFREGMVKTVQLHFNINGNVYQRMKEKGYEKI